MATKRVAKKLMTTPFDDAAPTGAVLMVNMADPQVNTVKVFLEAIKNRQIPYFVVGNKIDLWNCDFAAWEVGKHANQTPAWEKIEAALGEKLLPVALKFDIGVAALREAFSLFAPGSRVVILGVFNSGKSTLIKALTGRDVATGDIPGTTTEFTEYSDWHMGMTLIDTVGQVIDVSKPMMVSVDLSGCTTVEEKVARVLQREADAILATRETVIPKLAEAVRFLQRRVQAGGKIIVTGAGASALVAMEIAGMGLETGLPIYSITNNYASAHPVSFAKGTGEESGRLAWYIVQLLARKDVLIGVSASGGTGFVYEAMRLARLWGAATVAITENSDTPVGHNSDICIKSCAKPEGPSSGPIQVAHLSIGHALILALADERGVTADQAIGFMMPEKVATKKMGIK